MKPEGALTHRTSADLTGVSFEDALIELHCYPICTLRISGADVCNAQRVVGLSIPDDYEGAVVSPRVNIVIDPTYKPYEWSVEYDGRVFWSPAA